MDEVMVVDAVRTPIGRRGGELSGVHPADLSAEVLRALTLTPFERAAGLR